MGSDDAVEGSPRVYIYRAGEVHICVSRSLAVPPLVFSLFRSAVELGRKTLKGFKYFHLNNGSSQGQNLALTVLHVQNSLDSDQYRSNAHV